MLHSNTLHESKPPSLLRVQLPLGGTPTEENREKPMREAVLGQTSDRTKWNRVGSKRCGCASEDLRCNATPVGLTDVAESLWVEVPLLGPLLCPAHFQCS